jgi:hypothetical protein
MVYSHGNSSLRFLRCFLVKKIKSDTLDYLHGNQNVRHFYIFRGNDQMKELKTVMQYEIIMRMKFD